MVNTLNRLKAETGSIPQRIQVDNGPEFISKELDRWAYENRVILDFSKLACRQTILLLNLSMEVSETSV